MNPVSTAVFVASIALLAAIWWLVMQAHAERIDRRALNVVSIACVAVLVIISFTDWPSENLNQFWAEHSILGSTLTTILLAGAGLLGIEALALRDREALSDAVSLTAFGGLVDPLLDVDHALALIGAGHTHLPADWNRGGKPLRWIRDYRTAPPTGTVFDLETETSVALLDQGIRRLVGSARDWAALAAQSNEGREVLASFGEIRNKLVALSSDISAGFEIESQWLAVRRTIQLTASVLERATNSPVPRERVAELSTDTSMPWAEDLSRIVASFGGAMPFRSVSAELRKLRGLG